MELVNIWLPLIGGGVVFAIAIGAWFGEHKVLAIWCGFAGTVCLLLLFTLQIQHSIEENDPVRPSAAEIAAKQSRAYVFVEDAATSNIDDDMMSIGPTKIPSIRVIIKNSGQTPALRVTHQIAARLAQFPPPTDLFKLPVLPLKSVGVLPAQGFSMAEVGVGQPFDADQKTLLGLGRLAVYLFGRINYEDTFGNKWCTTYRMMAGGDVGFNGARMATMAEGNETDKNCDQETFHTPERQGIRGRPETAT